MDSTHPILPAELEFFNKGTGKGNLSSGTTAINNTSTVPLVVVFTKFDGQIMLGLRPNNNHNTKRRMRKRE